MPYKWDPCYYTTVGSLVMNEEDTTQICMVAANMQ